MAVTDGARVLLTPFRRMVVPPPMSAGVAALAAVPRSIAHAPASRTACAVLMADGALALIEGAEEVMVFYYEQYVLLLSRPPQCLCSPAWLSKASLRE